MPTCYHHLSADDRDRLTHLRAVGLSMRAIARALRRDPGTITHVSLELKKGTPDHLLLWGTMNRDPRELREGKSTQYIGDQAEIDWANVRRVIVVDATGSKYSKKVDRRMFQPIHQSPS